MVPPSILLSTLALAVRAFGRPDCPTTLNVDVAIVGGGASGSYAAAQLVDVHKKSVVLIEATGKLVCQMFQHFSRPSFSHRNARD